MTDLLVEGIDFYYENGLMVFTAEYLKKRGYCCRSGCRHCPYGYKPELDDRDTNESHQQPIVAVTKELPPYRPLAHASRTSYTLCLTCPISYEKIVKL
ncbi:MAG: DUF5522 domain-containing protein [Acidobacteriaceae bacterium]